MINYYLHFCIRLSSSIQLWHMTKLSVIRFCSFVGYLLCKEGHISWWRNHLWLPLQPKKDEEKKIPCSCNSINCRRSLNWLAFWKTVKFYIMLLNIMLCETCCLLMWEKVQVFGISFPTSLEWCQIVVWNKLPRYQIWTQLWFLPVKTRCLPNYNNQ